MLNSETLSRALKPRGLRSAQERHRGLRILLATLALFAVVPEAAWAGSWRTNETLLHDGVSRVFDVYEPDGLGQTPLPVLLLLHGGTQNKFSMRTAAPGEFMTLADEEGFLVLIPNGTTADGTTGNSGSFNWNDCRGDAPGALPTTDDVGFISALLDWTEAEYPVDTQRVYSTGASNGGMMSYRLAFEMSDRIAAIAAQIANLPAISDCPVTQPSTPISVLIMNGTADTLARWEGGSIVTNEGEENEEFRGTVLSALETRDFWRTYLMTDDTPTHVLYPDLEPEDAGRIESDLYQNGIGGSELIFYTATDAGHNYPSLLHPLTDFLMLIFGEQNQDVESAEEVWAFLSQHQLVPEPGFASALGLGVLGLSFVPRKRARRNARKTRAPF